MCRIYVCKKGKKMTTIEKIGAEKLENYLNKNNDKRIEFTVYEDDGFVIGFYSDSFLVFQHQFFQ